MNIQEIKTSEIKFSENFRGEVSDEASASMMASLKKRSLLQPIGIMPSSDGDGYSVIFGNRRLRAAKNLGWETITAKVWDHTLTRAEFIVIHLTENIEREGIGFGPLATAIMDLQKEGLCLEEIGVLLNKSSRWIASVTRVYKAVGEDIRENISTGAEKGKRKEGRIPLALVDQVMTMANTYNIDHANTNKLLSYIKKTGVDHDHLARIGRLIKTGLSFDEAYKNINTLRRVGCNILMPISLISLLEKKHKQKIGPILSNKIRSLYHI